MSYCRNNGVDSDVYVYADANFNGELVTCCCLENITTTKEEMILHLIGHIINGQKVPMHTFRRLIKEISSEREEK